MAHITRRGCSRALNIADVVVHAVKSGYAMIHAIRVCNGPAQNVETLRAIALAS